MEVKLRAHHLLCALCFEGKGYSKKFISNFHNIIKTLNNNNARVRIVEGLDDICRCCPNQVDNKCNSQKNVELLDANVINLINLNIDEINSWEHFKDKIKQNLTYNKLNSICNICSWKEHGICEKILIKHKFIE